MRYQKFGSLDFHASALGFGCMHFPLMSQDRASIKEKEAIDLIRFAVDHGINYLDTAYTYHKGQSEILLGKALKDGYRDRVKIATKLPIWMVKDKKDPDRFLDQQLKRLQTDMVDFYLVHSLKRDWWRIFWEYDIPGFLQRAMQDGRVGHVGFSFHDSLDLFKEIVDAYPWTLCQILLNHVDRHYQAGLEGLEYAAEKGLAVVIMEPLRGGKLVSRVPDDAMAVWNRSHTKRSPAEWALRWLWNQKGVTTVLSGMSTTEQVWENSQLAGKPPEPLTAEDKSIYDDVKRIYDDKCKVACSGCGYCQPCEQNVGIPDILALYNDIFMYDARENFIRRYGKMKERKTDASQCIQCEKCLEACPHHIPIMDFLEKVENQWESGS